MKKNKRNKRNKRNKVSADSAGRIALGSVFSADHDAVVRFALAPRQRPESTLRSPRQDPHIRALLRNQRLV